MLKSEFAVAQPWTTDTRSPQRWVFSHVRRNWGLVTQVLIGATGNAALAAAIPILTGVAFDAVTGAQPNLAGLYWAVGLIIFSQLVRSGLQLARNYGSEVLGQRLERDARQELYGSLLGKSMGFHDLHATGEIMARATNDVRELALMMAPGLNLVVGASIFLIMPILVAPRYHPSLVVTPILFAVGYVISMAFYLRDLNPVTAAVRKTFGMMNAALTEAMEGVATVKGAAQEAAESTRFAQNARQVRDAVVAQGRVEARFLPLLLLGLALGFALWHSLALYAPRRDYGRRRGGLHGPHRPVRFSGLHVVVRLFPGGVWPLQRPPDSGADPPLAGRRSERPGLYGFHAWGDPVQGRELPLSRG